MKINKTESNFNKKFVLNSCSDSVFAFYFIVYRIDKVRASSHKNCTSKKTKYI